MTEITRIQGIPETRPFGDVVQQIMDQGHGRTPEERQLRVEWRPEELAARMGCDRTTIPKWIDGSVAKPREFMVKRLIKAAFGDESSDHDLAVELRAAYVALGAPGATIGAVLPTATLPPKPDRFGRGAELDAVLAALTAPSPTVLVTGPPGIGKSHLSLQALHDPASVARHGDRRWFVRLDGATAADAVYPEIARTLGIESGSGLEKAVDSSLGAASGLLVLDNAETPWWAEARGSEAVFARLAAIEPLALVVSIRGDRAPPAPRWTRAIPVHALDEADASDLFNALTGARFADDPDLAGLLAAMDGVPLAIELLAKAIGTGETTLARIRRRWEDRRTALLADRRDAEGRLESWEISLRLSLDQLDAGGPELRLFALMGRLPDGVAEDQLDALLGEDGIDAADRLAELALVREQAARFRMLAPIRAFAADHCPAEPADEERRLAHYRGLAALGRQVGRDGGAAASRRLEADLRNIERAIEAGLGATDPTPAIEAAIRLRDFIRFSGLATDHLLRLAEARAAAGDASGRHAACAFALGLIALHRSDHDAAREHYQRALRLHQKVGDVLGEANCIKSLGEVAAAEGAKVEAVRLIGEALDLYARIPSPYSMGRARYHLAGLTSGAERAAHLAEARRLWEPLRLPHLLADLDRIASAPEP